MGSGNQHPNQPQRSLKGNNMKTETVGHNVGMKGEYWTVKCLGITRKFSTSKAAAYYCAKCLRLPTKIANYLSIACIIVMSFFAEIGAMYVADYDGLSRGATWALFVAVAIATLVPVAWTIYNEANL